MTSYTPPCLPSIIVTILRNQRASSSMEYLQDILDELHPPSWSGIPPHVRILRQMKSIHIYLIFETYFDIFLPLTLGSQSGQFPTNFRINFWRPICFMSFPCVLHAKSISSSLIRYLVNSTSYCLFSLEF